MDGGKKVWAPHATDGFILGTIADISETDITVEPLNKEKAIKTSYSNVFPAEDDTDKRLEDNSALMYLNEATLLNNTKNQYKHDQIYTYVATILIAVNPYHDIPNLYSSEVIKKYKGKSLGTMPPHVFAIGDLALREMRKTRSSQSIIVSGESGAGKTESTKYILRYLTESVQAAGSSPASSVNSIEQRIVEANPLLESFGNAKTTRNNNSSRFGKFVEVHYNERFQVVGGHVSHYLLEKSRITSTHNPNERSYHVFYRLCAGAPQALRQKLALSAPDQFHYLKHGCTSYFINSPYTMSALDKSAKSKEFLKHGSLSDPVMDDVADFGRMETAMRQVGLSDTEITDIFRVVAGVLHLGNIEFDQSAGAEDGSKISSNSTAAVNNTCKMLGFEPSELSRCLTSKMMQSGKAKGTVYMVPLKVKAATNARDALAKSIYSHLFDFIVGRVNECFPFSKSEHFIGVLDIAGFEYFQENSFEQFCINYCNEKLQQFFNLRTLKQEQELYQREGLGVNTIEFTDNQDCIDLVELKSLGIIDIMNEEMKLPKPNAEHFTTQVHSKHKDNFRLQTPRKSRLALYKSWRDEEGFLIRHFAGAVCYTTDQFLEKNNDALHASLEAVVCESSDAFVQKLFDEEVKGGSSSGGKLNFISVSSKFRSQLEVLMKKLEATGAHFIRCIKPNSKMVKGTFEGASVLSQLQCSGVVSALKVMESGFPCRVPFVELYSLYKNNLPPKIAKLDPRLFCKALFKAIGMNNNDFRFGSSKIFFRPGKFAEFDSIMKTDDKEHLMALIDKVAHWLICAKWKKAIYGAWEVIKLRNKIRYRMHARVQIQKTIRMFLAIRKFRPMYRGLAKVSSIRSAIENCRAIVNSIKGSSANKDAFNKEVDSLYKQMNDLQLKIKSGKLTKFEQIDAGYRTLVSSVEATASGLQSKRKEIEAAEERRLKEIERQMEEEKKRRAKEEAERLAAEKEKRERAEMEAKRKAEEEAEKEREKERERIRKQKEEELRVQEEQEKAEQARIAALLEQERRDRELAERLAREMQQEQTSATTPQQKQLAVVVEESPNTTPVRPPLQRGSGEMSRRFESAFKKYDLISYTYAELRDTINTSCDIELLEACREEFHRRLKVYHNWKANQASRNQSAAAAAGGSSKDGKGPAAQSSNEQRAPKDVVDHVKQQKQNAQALPNSAQPKKAQSQNAKTDKVQRYFRVPFIRPCDVGKDPQFRQKGWWFAHFDGDWVARQLELHPNKPPILLVAGKDDMRMCELQLAETGLTTKKGAEVLCKDFEDVWNYYGGPAYVKEAIKQGQVRADFIK
ncbi:unconventional myosin-VI-like isoform X2 [Convolutriloba macropyga]|uniref:unconventional myosin-VI-like isoform X2 n=1 Tax=Convolutriloba macropyga TaxID=536237 RepID=UPI003F51B712